MDDSQPASIDVERLRRRDDDAFTALVGQHRQLVAALAQSLGFSGADLDDALLEIFSEVYLSLKRFEGRSSLQTWVYRIAIRTLGKIRARRGSRGAVELHADIPTTDAASPGDGMEDRERHQRLWDAVAALDVRSATAVELHYRQGWPISRIAEAMECPQGTVKTILHRAREELRRKLATQEMFR